MKNVNDYFEQEQMRQTYICEKCNRSISVLTSYKFENFFEPKELKNVQITGAIPPKLDITCNKCRNRMTLLDEECVSFYIKLKEKKFDVIAMRPSKVLLNATTYDISQFMAPYVAISCESNNTVFDYLEGIKNGDKRFKYIAINKSVQAINNKSLKTIITITFDFNAIRNDNDIITNILADGTIKTSNNLVFNTIFKPIVQSYYDFLNVICKIGEAK